MSTDDTIKLTAVARTPEAITESTEEAEREALLDALDEHAERIRELAGTRDTAGTRERVHGAIADLQQLDAHLAQADRDAREAETAEAFADWATGGEDR